MQFRLETCQRQVMHAENMQRTQTRADAPNGLDSLITASLVTITTAKKTMAQVRISDSESRELLGWRTHRSRSFCKILNEKRSRFSCLFLLKNIIKYTSLVFFDDDPNLQLNRFHLIKLERSTNWLKRLPIRPLNGPNLKSKTLAYSTSTGSDKA